MESFHSWLLVCLSRTEGAQHQPEEQFHAGDSSSDRDLRGLPDTVKKSAFITLEGPDGCGKSTQSRLLAETLRKKGYRVLHTREPGGTSFAESLRRIILNARSKIYPMSELLLYEASRAQHTEEVIRPAMIRGKVVLCERYTDATVAYQGYGRGLDRHLIAGLNRIATGGLRPDLTIFLDLPVRTGLRRARRQKASDRLERENVRFHERVLRGYHVLAGKEPGRIKRISAEGAVSDVRARILEAVLRKLEVR